MHFVKHDCDDPDLPKATAMDKEIYEAAGLMPGSDPAPAFKAPRTMADVFAGDLEDLESPPKSQYYYAGSNRVTIPQNIAEYQLKPAPWFLFDNIKWNAYVEYFRGASTRFCSFLAASCIYSAEYCASGGEDARSGKAGRPALEANGFQKAKAGVQKSPTLIWTMQCRVWPEHMLDTHSPSSNDQAYKAVSTAPRKPPTEVCRTNASCCLQVAASRTDDKNSPLRKASLAANLAQLTVLQLMTTLCSVNGPLKDVFVIVRLCFVFAVGWHTMRRVGDLLLLR